MIHIHYRCVGSLIEKNISNEEGPWPLGSPKKFVHWEMIYRSPFMWETFLSLLTLVLFGRK